MINTYQDGLGFGKTLSLRITGEGYFYPVAKTKIDGLSRIYHPLGFICAVKDSVIKQKEALSVYFLLKYFTENTNTLIFNNLKTDTFDCPHYISDRSIESDRNFHYKNVILRNAHNVTVHFIFQNHTNIPNSIEVLGNKNAVVFSTGQKLTMLELPLMKESNLREIRVNKGFKNIKDRFMKAEHISLQHIYNTEPLKLYGKRINLVEPYNTLNGYIQATADEVQLLNSVAEKLCISTSRVTIRTKYNTPTLIDKLTLREEIYIGPGEASFMEPVTLCINELIINDTDIINVDSAIEYGAIKIGKISTLDKKSKKVKFVLSSHYCIPIIYENKQLEAPYEITVGGTA